MKYILIGAMLCLATSIFAQNIKDSVNTVETIPADSIYMIVEDMPEFPGGQRAMMEYISKNLKVSEIHLEEYPLYNEAFVSRFVVTKTGNIEKIEVKRTTNIPRLDSIYCDLIQNMPIWKPGTQNGKKVDVYYFLPIRARLQY